MSGALARLILITAVLGSAASAAAALTVVLQNRYLEHGLFRVAALTMTEHWNAWMVQAMVSLAVVAAASLAAVFLHDRLERRRRTLLSRESLVTMIAALVLFLVVGYEVNTRWLRRWYSPWSLAGDLGMLAGCLLIGAFLRWCLAMLRAPRRRGAALAALSVLALLQVLLNVASANDSRPADRPRWNLVWIVIDALRADHLGCYGYPRDTSPALDAFARRHVRFSHAYAQESYTQASVPSYFTSTYPFEHKVLYDNPQVETLDPRFLTIAEILRNDGYATAGFVFNPHLDARFGFDQGFELYDDNREGFDLSKPYHEAFETARRIHEKTRWLLETRDSRPLFLYLHYRDVHDPYAPPPPYDRLFLPPDAYSRLDSLVRQLPFSREVSQYVIDLYDSEIRYTDASFARLQSLLEAHGLAPENTIVVVTADHGEEFYDPHPDDAGGTSHGRTLYAEQLHVPLILAVPGVPAAVVEEPVGLVDLVPTLLDFLGLDPRRFEQFAGTSLAPSLRVGAGLEARDVLAGGNRNRVALRSGDWKYYAYRASCKSDRERCFVQPGPRVDEEPFGEELYNVRLDPGETVNRVHEHRELVDAMAAKARQITGAAVGVAARTVPLDSETRERLKALGYVHE